MADRAYFGFPRVTEQFPTLSGGNWLSTWPLSNAQELPLSYVARSLDDSTGSTEIILTASSPQLCSLFALVGHNMSQAATIRRQTWTNVAGTTGHIDSGFTNVWPASYTAAELDGAICTYVDRFADPVPATVGKIKLNITDTANAAGYIQIGFIEVADAFDVTYNFEPGSQYGFRWRSLPVEAIGGARYIDDRDHPRVWKGNFPFTTRADAMIFYEMQRQLRMHKPILFVPWPTETTHLLRTVMFAQQLDPGLSTMRFMTGQGLIDGVPLSLEEIIG